MKNKQISQNLFNIRDTFDYFEYLERLIHVELSQSACYCTWKKKKQRKTLQVNESITKTAKRNRHQLAIFKGNEKPASAEIIHIMFHDVAQQIRKKSSIEQQQHGAWCAMCMFHICCGETMEICIISFHFFLLPSALPANCNH